VQLKLLLAFLGRKVGLFQDLKKKKTGLRTGHAALKGLLNTLYRLKTNQITGGIKYSVMNLHFLIKDCWTTFSFMIMKTITIVSTSDM
jgi:hypothetical protein